MLCYHLNPEAVTHIEAFTVVNVLEQHAQMLHRIRKRICNLLKRDYLPE